MATLRLGDIAPDFEQESTEGRINFHQLKEKFPRGFRALKPYLRLTPQPNR